MSEGSANLWTSTPLHKCTCPSARSEGEPRPILMSVVGHSLPSSAYAKISAVTPRADTDSAASKLPVSAKYCRTTAVNVWRQPLRLAAGFYLPPIRSKTYLLARYSEATER